MMNTTEVEWWAAIRLSIVKPWPREAALMDLRIWKVREITSGGDVQRPGRPTLAETWGWTGRKVRQVIQAESEWATVLLGYGPVAKGGIQETGAA